MHLKRLRVRGFKSFPRATELVFEPGVAVIIGPNGSGKSNLADAVVWALGEQSPSTVRGSSMQDVIFAGSDGRRASAVAEVELVFDNADGALPLPTDEVSVMRRVGRDGGSHYSINRSTCRLTDVVELMAGVGLGRELHSIIGQGRVEAFLAGRPEDRRNQIEEAAGLGAYKRRRERAELKLREVRRNVERAELMERDAEGQLAPLRRQATAAEQMRAVDADVAGVRGRLLAGELAAVDEALTGRRGSLEALEAERARCEVGLNDLAGRRAAEEERFARRLAERERRARRLLRARALDGRLEGVERLTAQRLRLMDEVARAASAERERLLAELTVRAEEPAGSQEADEQRLLAALRAAEGEHGTVRSALEGARAALAERRAETARFAAEREAALATAARLERRLQALAGEQERLGRHLAALDEETGQKAARRDDSAAREQASRRCLEEAGARASTAAEAATRCESALADVVERHRVVAGERAMAETEVEHLDATMRDLQDVADDVLEVAERFDGAVPLTGTLACEPGYERALAAALSQASGALAVPSDVDHWSLLGALKHAGVTLARLVVTPRRRRASTGFPGAAPLLEKVSLGEREDLAAALADVVIVDDLRAVPDEFPGLAVTREGEFYRPSAGQLGLAGGLPAALLLERRALLAGSKDRLDAVRAREAREAAALAKARQADDAARDARQAAQEDEREARVSAEEAARELAGLVSRLRDIEDTLARTRRSSEALAAEAAEAQAAKEDAERSAAVALLETEKLRQGLAEAETAVAAAEADDAASLATLMRCRVELEETRAATARAAAERRAAQERAAAARVRLDELEARLSVLPALREACAVLLERLSVLRTRARGLVERLDDDRVDEVPERAGLQALASREAELRHALGRAADERAEVQVALARLEDRRADLVTQLDGVSAALELAAFTPPADDADAAVLAQTLERLERRRERIGPVNPLAEAECAELGERVAFLREQRRDLERSVVDLETLIAELTTQIDAEFAETFAAVQEQFSHMVEVLFPGGRGRLLLQEPASEDEPGGVSVEVKPARKLGKKLQLLSGGERALVAIAFLMALVLSRPCPFYILDEIEAALDDVNIGRLVQLLRDYRERTQFIIITHQKRTMEAADVLYGVTMGPDGGSAVVSARMAEEEIEREERSRTKG